MIKAFVIANRAFVIANRAFVIANRAFVIANRGRKANCHLLQKVSKRSSVSCAHLSPDTYTAGVEWWGTGHEELITSVLRVYAVAVHLPHLAADHL